MGYSAAQRQAILETIRFRANLDCTQFFDTLEYYAEIYLGWSAAKTQRQPIKNSDAKRRFAALELTLKNLLVDTSATEVGDDRNCARRLKRGHAKLNKILTEISVTPDLYDFFISAAEKLIDRGELQADLTIIEDEIAEATKTLEGLRWLRNIALEAAALAQLEMELASPTVAGKANAGNRPNEPLHMLVHVLAARYRDFGGYCREPSYVDLDAVRARRENERKSQEQEREFQRRKAQRRFEERFEPATTPAVRALLEARREVRLTEESGERLYQDAEMPEAGATDGLIRFLSLCLFPLGIRHSPEALRALYRRAHPDAFAKRQALSAGRAFRQRHGMRSGPAAAESSLTCGKCGRIQQIMLPPPIVGGDGSFIHKCQGGCGAKFRLKSKQLAKECEEFRGVAKAADIAQN
jgi:hypothetical protein